MPLDPHEDTLCLLTFIYSCHRGKFPLSQVESVSFLDKTDGRSSIYGIRFEIHRECNLYYVHFVVKAPPCFHERIYRACRAIDGFLDFQEYNSTLRRRVNAITSFQDLYPMNPSPFDVIGRVSEAPRLKRDGIGGFWSFSLIDKHGCTACCQLYTDDWRYSTGQKLPEVRKGDLAVCLGFVSNIDTFVWHEGERMNVLDARNSEVMFFNQ